MVKKIILTFCTLMIFISLASGIDTEIHVKTLPNHKVFVFIYPSGVLSMIDSYQEISNSDGEIAFVHSSTKPSLDILVKVTMNGQKVFLEKFEGYTAGTQIWIKLDETGIDGHYNPAAASPPTKSQTSTENSSQPAETQKQTEQNTQTPITGGVISDSKTNSNKNWILYLVISGILIAGLIVFFLSKNLAISLANRQNAGELPEGKGVFTALLKSNQPSYGPDKEIQKIEAEIKAAQEELEKIKNMEKTRLVEAKLEADKKELERLKKGF